MSASKPKAKEYEHIEFSFSKPSGRRNGKHYEITAYLLVPSKVYLELQQWRANEPKRAQRLEVIRQAVNKQLEAETVDDRAVAAVTKLQEEARELGAADRTMYESLLKKGALLHREDGPAYKEVEKSSFGRDRSSVVVKEQFWVRGVQKSSAAPGVKSLGKFKI